MTRIEIVKALARFEADRHRVVSVELFCDFAGISPQTYYHITRGTRQMTPVQQLRLERALKALAAGEVQVIDEGPRWGPGFKRTIGYRKKPRIEFRRGLTIDLEKGKFRLATGLVNVNDYTKESFGEKFGWRSSNAMSAKNTVSSTPGRKAPFGARRRNADASPENSSAPPPSEPEPPAPPTSTAR